MLFKIGDEIKLKNYSLYNDYKEHEGAVCKITNIGGSNENPDNLKDYLILQVKWKDGNISQVNPNNAILNKINWECYL